MRLSIRARLTLWYTSLLSLTVLALGAFLVSQLQDNLLEALDTEVRATAAGIARELTEVDPAAPAISLAQDFADAAGVVLPPVTSGAQLLDADGVPLHSYGLARDDTPMLPALPPGGRPPGPFTSTLPGDDDAYRVAGATLTLPDGRPAVVAVGANLSRVEDAGTEVLLLLAAAGPFLLGGTALGAYALARRGLQPVEQMTADAGSIVTERLHERLAVPRSSDEVGRLAMTLNAMLERIEQGVLARRRLVADASHELRTPLAVMRTELDVSLREPDLPGVAREVLLSTRDEVDRMARTVENLLTLAEVEEQRLALLPAPTDLWQTLQDAARPFATLAALKQVRMVLEGEPYQVQADSRRLRLAFTNLVDNAVKYTPSGGTVRVGTWCSEEEVGVTVVDDGPGVAPEHAEHVFDRFYRGSAATADGTGLGLAICREVAVAHGGRVWVDSAPGAGSVFTFALPLPRQVA